MTKKKPEQPKNDWKKILESITIAAIENGGACANERAWAHARLNHMRFESGNFRLFCISNNPCMWHVIHPNEQIAIYNVNETKYTNVHSFVFPTTVFCLVELYARVCALCSSTFYLTNLLNSIPSKLQCISLQPAQTSTKKNKTLNFVCKHIFGIHVLCLCFIAFHSVLRKKPYLNIREVPSAYLHDRHAHVHIYFIER